jgi:hypothetical protein
MVFTIGAWVFLRGAEWTVGNHFYPVLTNEAGISRQRIPGFSPACYFIENSRQ